MNTALPALPVVDIREGGPLHHARQSATTARALRDACLGFFPRAALPLVPAFDRLARRWLARSRSPYLPEIAEIAATLNFSGVWLLNASYQWGCTALACERDGAPWLMRTLDWPFTGLGRHTELAHMRGEHGDFFSVTWPGYVGVLTAMAPRRFAASVNQAPMRRRTRHPWLRPYDFAANALDVWACSGCVPPDQLLRRTFETCDGYAAARRLLERTPVARPVIYTLVGCAAHERCVIERTETDFLTREQETSAANDWLPTRPGWEGRIGTRRIPGEHIRGGGGLQPRAPRSAGRLERPARGCRLRLGMRAGPQSLHPARGRDVAGTWHPARSRLRRCRRRFAGAGDAAVRD